MNRTILAALALLALSACASTQPRLTPEQMYAQDQNACRLYGFKPDTDGFAECMMRLDVARVQMVQQQANYDQARFDASMRSLAAMGNQSVTCNTTAQVYSPQGTFSGGFSSGSSTTTCR